MSLATLARKTRAKQRVRTRGNFILNMTGRGNVLGMNAKMSRGNCKGLTKCAGKRAACCVGVGPQDNCHKDLVPTTQPDMTMVAIFNTPEGTYGYEGEWNTGSLIPTNNILNINTAGSQADRGTLVFDEDFGSGTNGGLIYNVGSAGGPVATFNTITFVADNGTSISYGSGTVTGTGKTWLNSSAQYNFWSPLPNGTTIQIFIDNTNPNLGAPYFTDPCCCRFPHGGKPAPQMGYGVYLNRKSKGAYHPGGGKQCKTLPGCERAKIVWKQGSNLDASVVSTNKKDNVLACNSDVYTAKRDTCTGCGCDDPDYSLTVGSDANSSFNFAGAGENYTMNIVQGSISSTTLVGADINWMGYQVGGNFNNIFTIALTTPNIPQDSFSSITFVNCNDNSMRTYNTVDASYNADGLWSGQYIGNTIWNWTEPIVQGGFDEFPNGVTGTVDSAERQWWADMAGVTLVTTPSAGPGGIPTIVGSQTTLQVFIDNPNPDFCCGCKCCPVKKNICGCRATDLVRYTRINKSFGCQTTKAVRMGRSASEQIARRRAAVDCIKPTHRTIHLSAGQSTLSFDGCCGNQCLIPGQQYTFVFTIVDTETLTLSIEWCTGLTRVLADKNWTIGETFTTSLTVPQFASLPCHPATVATIKTSNGAQVGLGYCKQAYKRPQMLGSCSGR